MKKRDYDTMYNENTGNTETHIAVDERLENEDLLAFEEGFAAASGIRPETAESGGRIKHPEDKDSALNEGRVVSHIEEEDAGLADS